MWLHCEEDEIKQRGDWKPVHGMLQGIRIRLTLIDEEEQPASLQSMIPAPAPPAAPEPVPVIPEEPLEAVKPVTEGSSFFASGDASESEPEEDVNPSKAWADLMLELDNAKLAAQKAGIAGKKKAKGGVETPETRRLKDRISAIESVYIFNKKEAGTSKASDGVDMIRHRVQGAQEQSAGRQPSLSSAGHINCPLRFYLCFTVNDHVHRADLATSGGR